MYSLYDSLCMPEADALHSVMTKLKLDQRRNKIDLGVGIYRDATGLIIRDASSQGGRTSFSRTRTLKNVSWP